MPIYEYRCDQGHVFEVRARMADDPVTSCLTCEASVQRVFHPIAVHFKGSGFYNTDYKNNSKTGKDSKDDSGSGDKSGDKKSDSKTDSKKSDSGSKSESKSSSSDKPKTKSSSD